MVSSTLGKLRGEGYFAQDNGTRNHNAAGLCSMRNIYEYGVPPEPEPYEKFFLQFQANKNDYYALVLHQILILFVGVVGNCFTFLA